MKRGGSLSDEVVAVDQKRSAAIHDVKDLIENALADLPDEELRLAALAETVDLFLSNYRQQKDKSNQTDESTSLEGKLYE